MRGERGAGERVWRRLSASRPAEWLLEGGRVSGWSQGPEASYDTPTERERERERVRAREREGGGGGR